MPKVVCPWGLITDFVTDAFVGYGVPREEAEICTDVLLESDKRGIESHGCNRFKPIYLDRIKAGIQSATTDFEIIKETETTAVVDGHNGMGQVIGNRAMKLAIKRLKSMEWVWLLSETHAITVSPDIILRWQPRTVV